jgi:hypothetical protein
MKPEAKNCDEIHQMGELKYGYIARLTKPNSFMFAPGGCHFLMQLFLDSPIRLDSFACKKQQPRTIASSNMSLLEQNVQCH